MKLSYFKRVISPEVGARLSGYQMEDVSFSKLDDLYMTGFLADDGERKVLLISFDLQCFDEAYIRKIRQDIMAKQQGEMTPEKAIEQRKEIMGIGIPGDSLVKQAWAAENPNK